MVIWRVIEILLKLVSSKTPSEEAVAHRKEDRVRVFSSLIRIEETIGRWRPAVRLRLKERAGFCDIERRIARSLLGSPLLLLPNGVARLL
jgi:hypothetical protein